MFLKIHIFINVTLMLFQLVTVFCKNVENRGLILIAQKRNRNNVQLTCITTDVGRALTWDTEITSQPAMPETNTLYTAELEDFLPDHFYQRENSLKNKFGPILDTRWEKLPTVISRAHDSSTLLPFIYLKRINLINTFELPISVKLELDGHIYICHDDKEPPNGNCYWIMLGAYNGTMSAIRKCKAGEISLYNEDPSGNCRTNLDEVERNPLSKNNWTHFSIVFDGKTKTVSVTFVGEFVPFLKFHDIHYDMDVPFTSLWVNSRQEHQGYWKLHSYDYHINRDWIIRHLVDTEYVTEFLCISMYVAMCESCGLLLLLLDYFRRTVVYKRSYITFEKSMWKKITFSYVNKADVNLFSLEVKIIETNSSNRLDVSPFLAIDNIVMSTNCFDKETKYSSITIKPTDINNTFCHFLIGDQNKLRIRHDLIKQPDINCSSDLIGTNCLACSEIITTLSGTVRNCRNTLICEKNAENEYCYCSAGSTGDYCKEDCTGMTYGINCNQTCGSCEGNICNGINGRCIHGCKTNFIEPNCQQAIFPILKAHLLFDPDCYTTCNVKFNSTSYIGTEAPFYYRYEYKKLLANSWISSTEFELQYNTFTLRNLEISTQYMVRVVLFTDSKEFFRDDIPFTNLTTVCKEITSDAVKLQADSKKAILSIKLPESSESCKLWMYYMIIKNENSENLKFKLAAEVNITNLSPHQNYTYTIYNQHNNAIISSKFQTHEYMPSVIRDMIVHHQYDSSSTEISISWNTVEIPNGDIKGYRIYYGHKKYIFCPLQKNLESQDTITTLNNYVNITGLLPYSTYTIKIKAINNNEGSELEVDVDTKPKDELTSDAYSIKATAGINQVYIKFTPKCEIISAPITMNVLVTCTETWCSSNKSLEIKLPKDAEIIDNLEPYSTHTLTVIISNQKSHAAPIALPVIIFKTKATVPNQVRHFDFYSTDSTSISLRWSPPYPPTGEIEGYIIEYANYHLSEWHSFDQWDNCTIWSWMYCTKITSLSENAYYYFKITATNFGVEGWSKSIELETSINIKKPLEPNNLIAYFDDQYNIIAEWQHPNKTNGHLQGFSIGSGIMGEFKYYILEIEKENFTYKSRIPDETDEPSLTITVQAINRSGGSPIVEIKIKCPPPIPKLTTNPEVKSRTEDYIALEIPPTHDSRYNSSLYVVISKALPNDTFAPYTLANGILSFKSGKWWIAREFSVTEVRRGISMILGDNTIGYLPILQSKYYNRKLEPGIKYRIYVVVYNQFMDQRRTKVYTIETSTDHRGTKYNTFVILVMLLVVICIIAFLLLLCVLLRNHFKKTTVKNEHIYDEPITIIKGDVGNKHENELAKAESSYPEENHYDEIIHLQESSKRNSSVQYAKIQHNESSDPAENHCQELLHLQENPKCNRSVQYTEVQHNTDEDYCNL